MQLFRADAVDPEKVKKHASKVAHNGPRPFYFTVQTTAHSPELIFHIVKSRSVVSLTRTFWRKNAVEFYVLS